MSISGGKAADYIFAASGVNLGELPKLLESEMMRSDLCFRKSVVTAIRVRRLLGRSQNNDYQLMSSCSGQDKRYLESELR